MINIDEILKEKGLKKKQVAERMGITRENLYRVLGGNPTLENIERLSRALGVPTSKLFSDADIIGFVEVRGKTYKITSFDDLRLLLTFENAEIGAK